MSNDDQTVWITSEPSVDGSRYVTTLAATDDHARILTPDDALSYAHGVLQVAHRAAYDAAVLRQMTVKLGLDLITATQLLTALRRDRPALDHQATEPLRFEPGVTKQLKPFLIIYLAGQDEPLGQWEFEQARQHALGVIETTVIADLDGAYKRALVSLVGIETHRAHNVVGDLGAYR